MKNSYPKYEEAKKLVNEKGIFSRRNYDLYYKELGLPSAPNRTYKDSGWTNWDDFLNKTGTPSYEEANKRVLEKGIKTPEDYKLYYQELGLPKNPNRTYKDKGWIKWDYFLGKYPTYKEAKKVLTENGISTKRQYESSQKELGLPSDPRTYYKEEGWTDWNSFLGKSHKITSEEKLALILEKLSIAPDLLKEDAPLQIIYLLATKLDKRIAKEIEELLNTSSYEDRVKWVKNQLDRLKEGSSVKPTTSVETPTYEIPLVESDDSEEEDPDEFPIMEPEREEDDESPSELSTIGAVVEVLQDSTAILSEEDTAQIRTWMENYYHSVVNKELIKEKEGE